MINKKYLFWAGICVLGVLIVYNSTKKAEVLEITDTQEHKTFDNSTLPKRLQPPYKMADGDPMPKQFASKRVLGLSLKPRFDSM